MTIPIFVDAYPVKGEVYKVALRLSISVIIVANSYLRVPRHELIDQFAVEMAPDAADDPIAERADKAFGPKIQ